ncbi:MAG: C40 family peptidase [Acidobacteriia bacterium]|nr:C40 family peptidase [Terriglobia bacterium]
MPTREQIVAAGRSWIGTPFVHQGRVKGQACDCVGLPIMVAKELGIAVEDETNYTREPEGTRVLDGARERMVEKPIAQMQPGDVIILRLPHSPCHTALVASLNGHLTMIHAYNRINNEVVENYIDQYWRRHIAACFTFKGVE